MKNIYVLIICFTLFCLIVTGYNILVSNRIPSENIHTVLNILDDDTSGIAWPSHTTINLNTLTSTTSDGIQINNSHIIITQGGTYSFSGNLSNGYITIDTSDTVNLSLSNASITNLSGAALYLEKANKVYITLMSNTQNYLINYNTPVITPHEDTIYNNSNIIIQGGGTLEISSNYQN